MAEAKAKVSSNSRLFAGLGMANGHRRTRRTHGPHRPGRRRTLRVAAVHRIRADRPRGGHIAPSSGGGTGELAGARADPARRTLRMAQVARGEAVHGIALTPVHGAGAASPAGDGGVVAEFDSKSATSAARGRGTGLAKLMTVASFGTVRLGVFCHHGCASLLDGGPGSAASGFPGRSQSP